MSTTTQRTMIWNEKKSFLTRVGIAWLLTLGSLLAMATSASAHSITWSTASFEDSALYRARLLQLRDSHETIDEISVSPSGEWVIVSGSTVFTSIHFPAGPKNKIQQYLASGREIDAVAFAPNGSWVVVAEDYLWRSAGLPHSLLLKDKIRNRQNAGKRIDEIAFTGNGAGWVVTSGSWASSKSVPADLYAAVVERHQGKRKIQRISIGTDGRWVVLADQWFASSGLSNSMVNGLKMFQRTERSLDHAVIGPGNGFVLYGGGVSPNLNHPMQKIEYDLGASSKNIYQRMEELNIPGISIAVIDNNKVVYARGYGTLRGGTQKFVRASSPFAVGSTSKLMASMGIMSLVEDGELDLDDTLPEMGPTVVNWYTLGQLHPFNYGTLGPLPLNITLEQLLSHTASLNNSSIEYWPSNWPGSVSTLQTLLGYHCSSGGCTYGGGRAAWIDPANGAPGSTFDYSNKGYLVAQAAAQAATGQGFAQIMQDRILGPLGMTDSRYTQPLSLSYGQRVASRHDTAGDPIPRTVIPNYAAGGLYASARDYAKAMILLNNDGQIPNGAQVLSPPSVDEIFTDRAPGGLKYGFGVELNTTALDTFTHGGAVIGGSSCMQGSVTADEGIVILTNSDYTNARPLMTEIRRAFREAYGWPIAGDNPQWSC